MRGSRPWRPGGRLADFMETLGIVIVTGSLTGFGFVVAVLLFTWVTATFAA